MKIEDNTFVIETLPESWDPIVDRIYTVELRVTWVLDADTSKWISRSQFFNI